MSLHWHELYDVPPAPPKRLYVSMEVGPLAILMGPTRMIPDLVNHLRAEWAKCGGQGYVIRVRPTDYGGIRISMEEV